MDNEYYASEEEFLKNYDDSKYEKLSLTTDILVMSISTEQENNYRKLSKKKFSILLVKRENYPFKGKWCLPGGFVKVNESLDDSAKRILQTETNLNNIYIEQLYTFGDVNRDPRTRVISVSYMALIDKNRLDYNLNKNTSWFNVSYEENDKEFDVLLDNGAETIRFVVSKHLRNLTTDRYDFKCKINDKLAFDHALTIVSGIERLKNKIEYTDIIFNMMPKYFTLGELQQVYEVILNKKLLDPAFRRIISSKVKKTDKIRSGGGHRPSILYKYNKEN